MGPIIVLKPSKKERAREGVSSSSAAPGGAQSAIVGVLGVPVIRREAGKAARPPEPIAKQNRRFKDPR